MRRAPRLAMALGLLATGFGLVAGGRAGAQSGPLRLFDGKTMNGWYTFIPEDGKNKDPRAIFKIEDGMFHVSGEKFGYLSTEREYENFRLSVDFKWGQKKWPPRENVVRDAGLLYHCAGPDMVWAKCVELQIQEGDTGDLWLIPGTDVAPAVDVLGKRLGGGKDYINGKKFAEYEKPHGEWNTVTVVAKGDRIEHWVNGRCNMVGTRSSSTRGRIQLQSEGAEIFYRNVVLEPLP